MKKPGRDELGKLTAIEYTIYEIPQPCLENPTQINKDRTNTQIQNTECIKYPSINQSTSDTLTEKTGLMDRYRVNIELIKNNMEYTSLIHVYDKSVIDEIVSVMSEVLTIDTPYYTIEKKQYPTELVRQRFLEINCDKLEAFMLEFTRRTEKIHNTKAYSITSLLPN